MIAFLLTLLYIALLILRVEDLFPALAPYSPMLVLGVFASLASLPNIQVTNPFSRRETHLLLLFFAILIFSDLIGLWFGGAILAVKLFTPCLFAFFLIITNVTTRGELRALLLVVVLSAVALAVQAILAYHWGYRSDQFLLVDNLYEHGQWVAEFARAQGLGWLNDPNDFAQFLLACIPLAVMLAAPGGWIRNIFLVAAPSAILAYGVFLTRSRGALVGVALVLLFALRRRMGKVGSAMISVLALAGLLAMGFTGGRGMSLADGSDRLEIWSDGLGVFRSHPLLGVGFNRYGDFSGQTAHNSYLLCATEVGLIGFTVWMGLLALTVMRLNHTVASGKAKYESAIAAGDEQRLQDHRQAEWCRVALVAFLATAFFLSRTYAPLLYILLAIALVLNRLASEGEDEAAAEAPRFRWVRAALISEVASLAVVYVFIRLFHAR